MDINPKVSFGLCHGTRRGFEQKQIKEEFSKRGKDVNVIGTEISDTANQFESTIEWDFHNVHPDWVNNVDFIYSNSLYLVLSEFNSLPHYFLTSFFILSIV